MPEGDTVHRAAATLRRALVGQPVEEVLPGRAVSRPPVAGTTVERVEARGKHLLVWFSDGTVLHTHLGMTGTWRVHPRTSGARRPRGRTQVVITVPAAVAVCDDPPVAEFLDAAAVARHPSLRALGPDLTAAEPDVDEALARMRRLVDPATPVAAALLDQRVASGIGNVYASELCFLHAVDPRHPVGGIGDDERRALLVEASRLLTANLATPRRTTVPGAVAGRLWVYGRAGRPCRRCATPVVTDRVGPHARITYRCPRCQPPG